MNIRRLLPVLFLSVTTTLFGQSAPRPKLTPTQAHDLAELMCHQLPNVGTILETIKGPSPGASSAPPPQEPIITDDVYDALLRLGPYSLGCLLDKLTDPTWMPDPRSEPLLGVPVVGDVAYMALGEKGVPDMLPRLTNKKPNDLRMDDYFIWPGVGDHRQRLQRAVRAWVLKHPDCCGTIPVVRATEPPASKFRMSGSELAKAKTNFARLRVGMSPDEVLKIEGKPDAIDHESDDPDHWHKALLGYCSNDHNENLAYIYFTERWAVEISRRDPLRDRYLIVFFSGAGKLTRMFSNVAEIPAILPPRDHRVWERIAWGSTH